MGGVNASPLSKRLSSRAAEATGALLSKAHIANSAIKDFIVWVSFPLGSHRDDHNLFS